jgi:hypothetical protein
VAAIALLLTVVGWADSMPARGEPLDDLLPHTHIRLTAEPAPVPVPSEGRIPVSLRLAGSIWTDDESHPSAATEVRFDLARRYRLDLAGIPVCKNRGGRDTGRDVSPCDVGEVARGKIEVEVLFPEQAPSTVAGEAVAYKTGSRTLAVWAYLPAPITGAFILPVKIDSNRGGPYGPRFTVAIPKIAGGSGSLTYLGLRFRKGLFSLACPHGRLQSRLTDTFADGTQLAGVLVATC